jgi:hypothetical protein
MVREWLRHILCPGHLWQTPTACMQRLLPETARTQHGVQSLMHSTSPNKVGGILGVKNTPAQQALVM